MKIDILDLLLGASSTPTPLPFNLETDGTVGIDALDRAVLGITQTALAFVKASSDGLTVSDALTVGPVLFGAARNFGDLTRLKKELFDLTRAETGRLIDRNVKVLLGEGEEIPAALRRLIEASLQLLPPFVDTLHAAADYRAGVLIERGETV